MSSDAVLPAAEPPKIIAGRYRLGRALGQGTYGQVYYAEDIKFDPPRTVAVKLLHAQFLNDAQSREDIRREASVLARFHHPNILRVSDFEISPELAYIVTDFAEGGSLANKLKPETGAPPLPMPLNEAIYYLEQIASALDEAHNLGLIHRDIKPLNILLDRAGRPLLADFGLATVLSGTSSSMVNLSASGTPLYMAPEQWAGKAGKASDIYALGVVTYQLVTGQPPYQGNQAALWAQHTGAPIPTLREKAPWLDYPPALDSVIAGVMAKDDRERTRPAGEFARRFKMALLGYQSTPFNYQNTPQGTSGYVQGPSGPLSPSSYLPGSNLPPSTVPPNSQPGSTPHGSNPSTPPGARPPYGTTPGSQPLNYPPGRPNYENAPSLPPNAFAGPGSGQGQPPVTPGYPPNQFQAGNTNPPQSAETAASTPFDASSPGGQGSQPYGSPQFNSPAGSQPARVPPYSSQTVSGPPGSQTFDGPTFRQPPPSGSSGGQPPYYSGQVPPGGPSPNWNANIPAPGPVTKKGGRLNLILLGVAALLVVAVVGAALVLFLPGRTPGPTSTVVAGGGDNTTSTGPTGQVQVTVTEASGKPAREADVNLKVFKQGSDTALKNVYNKATATIPLPPGTYTVQALYPNDIAVMSPAFQVKEGQTVLQNINLGLGTVQVTVVEAAGRSPRESDLALKVYKDGDTSKTITTVYNKANTSIYLPPGAYQLETDYSNDIRELGPTFKITEGQATTQAVNLGVGTVAVQVFETTGKLAHDDTIVMKVHKQDDPNVDVTTIYSKAKTSITLKEGSYQIAIEYAGGAVNEASQPFDIKAGQTVSSTINLGVGTAQVTVQAADGSKLDESKLTLRIYAQDDPNDTVSTVYNKATADFTLKPGTYLVEVQYDSGSNAKKVTGDPLVVKEGQNATQTIKI